MVVMPQQPLFAVKLKPRHYRSPLNFATSYNRVQSSRRNGPLNCGIQQGQVNGHFAESKTHRDLEFQGRCW